MQGRRLEQNRGAAPALFLGVNLYGLIFLGIGGAVVLSSLYFAQKLLIEPPQEANSNLLIPDADAIEVSSYSVINSSTFFSAPHTAASTQVKWKNPSLAEALVQLKAATASSQQLEDQFDSSQTLTTAFALLEGLDAMRSSFEQWKPIALEKARKGLDLSKYKEFNTYVTQLSQSQRVPQRIAALNVLIDETIKAFLTTKIVTLKNEPLSDSQKRELQHETRSAYLVAMQHSPLIKKLMSYYAISAGAIYVGENEMDQSLAPNQAGLGSFMPQDGSFYFASKQLFTTRERSIRSLAIYGAFAHLFHVPEHIIGESQIDYAEIIRYWRDAATRFYKDNKLQPIGPYRANNRQAKEEFEQVLHVELAALENNEYSAIVAKQSSVGEAIRKIYEIYPLELIQTLFPKTHEKLTQAVNDVLYKQVITYDQAWKEQSAKLKNSQESSWSVEGIDEHTSRAAAAL